MDSVSMEKFSPNVVLVSEASTDDTRLKLTIADSSDSSNVSELEKCQLSKIPYSLGEEEIFSDYFESSVSRQTVSESISSESSRLPPKTACCRFPSRKSSSSSNAPKKRVQVQALDTKKCKASNKPSIKKEKVPDTTAEIEKCRQEKRDYLDFGNVGLQTLPSGIFKDVGFIENLFLYGNKLTAISPSLCSITSLHRLMLQQNCITCAGLLPEIAKLKFLEVLDLRHNRLEGTLPDCIYELTNLEQLILSYNKISKLSDALKNLKRLSILIINRNSLYQHIPNTIGQLSNLTTLDISYNHIESLPPSLCQCTSLQDLNIQHNQLTNLPENIGNLTCLTRLTLKYNHLVAIPESLKNCTKLDEFNVESNQLASLPVKLLSSLVYARNVTLSRNLFTAFPAVDPELCSFAVTLNMDHNRICALPQNVFSKSHITKLNLRDNEIKNLSPSYLQSWNNLKELDLGSNYLSSLPSECETLQELKVLKLNYNQLKSLPQSIGSLQNLRTLDLESNQLESLPTSISCLTNLLELNVSCNRLTAFPSSIGSLSKLKVIKAGENDIRELPAEMGNMSSLRDLHLNHNLNLNNLPVELSLCSTLNILDLENCPLRDLPQPIVANGSAMIIYFLQQVLQIRRQQTAL